MLLTYIFLPLVGAAIMPLWRKISLKGTTLIITLVTGYQIVLTGWIIYRALVVNTPLHLEHWILHEQFMLKLDGLSVVVLLAIGIVGLATAICSLAYPLDPDRRPGYNAVLMLVLTGMNGLVMTVDLFSLYVFLEIISVGAFILIAYQLDEIGIEGAFKYLLLSGAATSVFLIGLAFLFALTGSVSFADLAVGIKTSGPLVRLALILLFFTCAVKAGLIPFHGWLPDAYTAAPAPISVLLAGIMTKVGGVYMLMRLILSVFGFSQPFTFLLLMFGAVSTVFGAFWALGQRDFKRMLAFSSISQIGYIMMGFATGTPLGVLGAVLHFLNHAVFKSLLFLNAGAVEMATGSRDVEKLGGLANRMPITGITSVIGILSTAGIPPLAGFWSKLMIIIALWTAGYPVFALIAVFASVVTLAYLLALQRNVFFGQLRQGLEGVREVSPALYGPAIGMAVLTIGGGLLFPMMYEKLLLPIQAVLTFLAK